MYFINPFLPMVAYMIHDFFDLLMFAKLLLESQPLFRLVFKFITIEFTLARDSTGSTIEKQSKNY